MKTIEIKFEGTEVTKKFVDYSVVLEIIRKEDDRLTEIWKMYCDKDDSLADTCLDRAVEADLIRKRLIKVFGGEFD